MPGETHEVATMLCRKCSSMMHYELGQVRVRCHCGEVQTAENPDARRQYMCNGKRRHATPEAVESARKSFEKAHPGQEMVSYRCRFCGSWHFGHRREVDEMDTVSDPYADMGIAELRARKAIAVQEIIECNAKLRELRKDATGNVLRRRTEILSRLSEVQTRHEWLKQALKRKQNEVKNAVAEGRLQYSDTDTEVLIDTFMSIAGELMRRLRQSAISSN